MMDMIFENNDEVVSLNELYSDGASLEATRNDWIVSSTCNYISSFMVAHMHISMHFGMFPQYWLAYLVLSG